MRVHFTLHHLNITITDLQFSNYYHQYEDETIMIIQFFTYIISKLLAAAPLEASVGQTSTFQCNLKKIYFRKGGGYTATFLPSLLQILNISSG